MLGNLNNVQATAVRIKFKLLICYYKSYIIKSCPDRDGGSLSIGSRIA